MERIAKVAVIVIDENGSDATRTAQQEILFFAAIYGHPVAFIEYDPTQFGYPKITTDPELKKIAAAAPVFVKYQSNGFIDTGLEAWLKEKAPTHVVVMGMETNACVKALVIGGWTVSTVDNSAILDEGLVGRKYHVMTANALVHDAIPDSVWGNHPMVEIYAAIDGDD